MANVPTDGWGEEKQDVNTTETRRLIWNELLDLVYPPCCLVCRARMEEKAVIANIYCQFAFVVPASYPGNGPLVLKDK